jgi:hypothetical protein
MSNSTSRTRIRSTGGTAGAKRRMEARQGLAMAKRGVRGIYEVLWYRDGAGEVRSLVNRTVIAEYTPGLGWEDHGRLPDDVREYAQQIASVGEGAGGVVPHHETSEQSQPKKSHAQIKREVDKILAGRHSGTSNKSSPPRPPIPGFAFWNRISGWEGQLRQLPHKYKYFLYVPGGAYHIDPISQNGRYVGYGLKFASRSGLSHDLGMHRSPAMAVSAARKHYAASY